MKSLAGEAAQLPEIPLQLPERFLGKNTAEAMNAGILWGYVGQVNYMVDKIISAVPYDVVKIATGGLSEVLKPLSTTFDIIDRQSIAVRNRVGKRILRRCTHGKAVELARRIIGQRTAAVNDD